MSGHHGTARKGELHLFDVSKGTIEDGGRVHKFPSYGRVYKAEIKDRLVDGKYPHLIHPYPLSEKYVVASVFNHGDRPQGIYLVDAFDNMTLLQADAGRGYLFEPVPVEPRKLPPEIMDKTDRDIDYGYVFLNDIYQGPGLKGVPRGTVKALRIFEYFYCYRDIGSHDIIGNEASWDVKRIHGTVPVEPRRLGDVQGACEQADSHTAARRRGQGAGADAQLVYGHARRNPKLRGRHEGQGMTPSTAPAMAARKRPSEIKQFIAPVRGYSFVRDVQPVLDQYCAGCHNPKANKDIPNFSRENPKIWKHFPESYLNLSKYVRRSGPESNQHLLSPLEFHVDTSELTQMLKKGHKGVKLDPQSMKILITWMDLNVPCVGTWKEIYPEVKYDGYERRKFFLSKYANRTTTPTPSTTTAECANLPPPPPRRNTPGPRPRRTASRLTAARPRRKLPAPDCRRKSTQISEAAFA